MGLFDSIFWQTLLIAGGPIGGLNDSDKANELAEHNKLSAAEASKLFPKFRIEKQKWDLLSEKAKFDLIKLGFHPQVLDEEYFRLKYKYK